MKKENIVSDLKTFGIAATAFATFSLHSCSEKPLTTEQKQTIEHKTDSAVNNHHEYIMASGLSELCENRIKYFRDINRVLVKQYSQEYIKQYIQDAKLRKFMFDAIQDENIIELMYANSIDIETDSIENNDVDTMTYIRANQKWFNDLMLYLTYRYNDKQLLNSEFFKTINNKYLKRNFEHNAMEINKLNEILDFTSERKTVIYNNVRQKYTEEIKHTRQR